MRKIAKVDALPCPFCGSSDGFVEAMTVCVHRYFCNDCAALGPPAEHGGYDGCGDPRAERDAIKAWNRRKTPKKTKAASR